MTTVSIRAFVKDYCLRCTAGKAEKYKARIMRRRSFSSLQQKKNLKTNRFSGFAMVDSKGLEPLTLRTSSGCSSQLS